MKYQTLSKLIRRTHMYLALFLMPWVLMYAVSTIAMNHSHFFEGWYGEPRNVYQTVEERTLNIQFSEDLSTREAAKQILRALNMDGSHKTSGSIETDRIIINRHSLVKPKRITFTPSTQTLVIDEQVFRTPHFLERVHRARGYNQPYWANDIWAVIVDSFITAMVLWGATGLWMWWEIKTARRWGWICLIGGAAIFGFFLFTI